VTTPNSNGFAAPATARDTFQWCLLHGLNALPGVPRTKEVALEGEGVYSRQARIEDRDAWFPLGQERNLGVVNGELSGGLGDVDGDSAEVVTLAPRFLPSTPWRFRRADATDSAHWEFRTAPTFPESSRKYLDPTLPVGDQRATLVELRGTGGWTIWPPSVHPTGVPLVWESLDDRGPAQVRLADLERAVGRLAGAALLCRYWPATGNRDDAAMALAGGLTRAGWTPEEVDHFVGAVAEAAGDEEARARASKADRTAAKQEGGQPTTGWRRLAGLLGERGKEIVESVRSWLGMARAPGGGGGDRVSVATRLVRLALEAEVGLFHTVGQVACADVITESGCRQTWPLRSGAFHRWLRRLLYQAEGKAAGSQAVADAVGVLEGRALFDGAEIAVHTRLAGHEGKIYLDLADAAWRAVEIDAAGWRVVAAPPVRFRRPAGLLPLPEPTRGGSLDELRRLVNVPSDDAWRLLVAWLLAALRPSGPYPVLALLGEAGTAKSSTGRWLRQLVDPSETPLRSEPREDRDLMVAATNGWVVAYDNISYLPQWLSDAISRVATGGGFGTRKLYTDDEETLFSATRPVVLTSITDVITASDLLDRSLLNPLEPIPEDRRLPEGALNRAFEAARPGILGALLDGVSAGLRNLPDLRLSRLPRMADFALWAEACCRGLGWAPEAFLDSYTRNRRDANTQALESSLVYPVLVRLLDSAEGGRWDGVARELLDAINSLADEKMQKRKGWPALPHHLTGHLRRIAPNLRRAGIEVCFTRDMNARRVTLEKVRKPASSASSASPASPNSNEDVDLGDDANGTGVASSSVMQRHRPGDADDASMTLHDAASPRPASSPNPVSENDLSGGDDAADADDAENPSCSSSVGAQIDALAEEVRTTTLPPCAAPAAGEDVVAVRLDDTCPAETTPPPVQSSPYLLVDRPDLLPVVLAALEESDQVGLDVETSRALDALPGDRGKTALDPRRGRPRLLSLGTATVDGGVFAYLLDLFALPPASLPPLWGMLREKEIIGHNLAFDLAMLSRLGFTPGDRPLHDVMILSRLLTAGGRDGNSLADLTQRYLGFRLGKAEQKSDWSVPALGEAQLTYAAGDVLHLDALLRRLGEEIDQAELGRVAEIERRCLPGWVWMTTAGMAVDRAAWGPLAERSRAERDRLRDELHRLAPARGGDLPGIGGGWNFDSQRQVKGLLAALNIDVKDTSDRTLAGIDHPFVELLRQYRSAKWLDGTFGRSFLRFLDPNGRIYAHWNQTGNEAGRSACKEPNLQLIPRQEEYRRAFVAPPGRVLVKADFSAVHLRIAARVAPDEKMIAAFVEGKDLHRITAASLLGKPKGEVTGKDRQLAKAVAFGLLYGMGAKTLRVTALQNWGVEMTLAEAARHKRRFFETYPGLARWHRQTEAARERQTETRSLAGRRRLLDPKTPIMHRLNSPVLGTEGDAAKTALALLWERRAECPGAVPVAFVHDEIVLEADEAQASRAEAWVRAAMVDALAPLIDPVPVEVEVKVARSWGGEP
jgi:DNA polymerase I-like protein with 3'-5' exonuclease and polymerase domains